MRWGLFTVMFCGVELYFSLVLGDLVVGGVAFRYGGF